MLDMRSLVSFCDYFVIASGTSLRQVNALRDSIQEGLLEDKIKPLSRAEANDRSGWIVLDYSAVVVHIFHEPMRDFYALEHVWAEAKKIRIATAA